MHESISPTIPMFDFGKYRGLLHEEVLDCDPSYVKWAYEKVADHAGISRSTYAAACEALPQHGSDDDGDRWEGIEDFDEPRFWGDLD